MRARDIRFLSVLVAALGVASAPAWAQEVLLRNDSLPDENASGYLEQGFANDEIPAATFIVPQDFWPVWVKRVQILWLSPNQGGAPNDVQDAILVWAGKAPDKLQLVYESAPPQLTDGYLNEFDFSGDQIIIDKPANTSTITVGMRFLDAPLGDHADCNQVPDQQKATVVVDTDGCQLGLNPLDIYPPCGGVLSWKDGKAVGLSGDLVIRAVVEHYSGGPPCPPDLDLNGTLDLFDFLAFTNLFNASDDKADFNGDGLLDLFDFLAFTNAFNAGC